jgi:hypothetical protein
VEVVSCRACTETGVGVEVGVELVAEAAMVRLRAEVTTWGEDSESRTVTLKEEEPLVIGVPLMAPLVERVSPAGRAPDVKLHV